MEYSVGESPQTPKRTHPDRDRWLCYPWPGTRLTEEHRYKLCLLSNELKIPITQVLADAVEMYYELMRNEL
jgi:hypothetical protein